MVYRGYTFVAERYLINGYRFSCCNSVVTLDGDNSRYLSTQYDQQRIMSGFKLFS